jgi:hypothetical protein
LLTGSEESADLLCEAIEQIQVRPSKADCPFRGSRTTRARVHSGLFTLLSGGNKVARTKSAEESGFEAPRILFSATHTHSVGADIPGAVALWDLDVT